MKRTILFFILISVLQIAYGQVETRLFPQGDAFDKIEYIKEHPKAKNVEKLPAFDAQKMRDEDKLNEGLPVPFRFGKGFNVNLTLADGEWADVEDGRLWSMEFQSDGAYSINFVFDNFYLSASAQLYIVNAGGTILYGPVSSEQNTKSGYF